MFARIVTGQPDFNLLPPGTSMPVRFLLETMLNKNAAQRLQHVGDVRWFLDSKFFPTTEFVAAAPQRKPASVTIWIVALVAILLAAFIPTALYLRSSSSRGPDRLMRFELTVPGLVGGVMPSPDGERLAYIAQSVDGTRAVWIRPIGSETSQKLPGTDNSTAVLWSPDGRFLFVQPIQSAPTPVAVLVNWTAGRQNK
jgi:hypothetical protein